MTIVNTILDWINWCDDNYWWFVLVNLGIVLISFLSRLASGEPDGYPGCGILLILGMCLLGPVMWIFAAIGLVFGLAGLIGEGCTALINFVKRLKRS